jgi:hypothetical protein
MMGAVAAVGGKAGTSKLVAREVEVDQLAEVTHVIQVVEAVVGERESDEGGQALELDVAQRVAVDDESLELAQMFEGIRAVHERVGGEVDPGVCVCKTNTGACIEATW